MSQNPINYTVRFILELVGLFALGRTAGWIAQAIEQYQKAIEMDSQFALAYAHLSMAYARKFRRSARHCSSSMNRHPTGWSWPLSA